MASYPGQGYYPGQEPPPPGFLPGGGGYPQSGYPQPGYPQPGYPPQGGYPPQAPPGGYPTQPGYPPSYPQQDYPKPPNYSQQPPMSGYHSGFPEDPMAGDQFGFTEKSIRLGFIRKVYGILMCQLAVTLAIVCLFTFHAGTRQFVKANPSLWWVALVLMFVCLIVMACCGEVRRKAPANFIFLGLFTFAESFMLGCATVHYQAQEVALAVGITTVLVLGLTLFAFQTKIDFTMMGGILLVCALVLMLFGLCLAIFGTGKILTLVYASLGALIFSVYIIYDTQLMLGGNHKYSISPEEYIFAALNLYLDIVNLFLYILTIIGASRD